MKSILTSLAILISAYAISQSHSKGTLSLNLNFDYGIHGVISESYYNGTLTDTDTTAAGTRLVRFDAQYNILKFLSLGFNYRKGDYIEDLNNTAVAGNKISVFGFGIRTYPVNKDKFNLFAGINFGGSSLEIRRNYTFIVTTQHRSVWKAPHYSFDLGFNWYFLKNFGMNFIMAFSGHNYDLKEYYIDGDPQDLSNQQYNLISKGFHINLGLSFKIFGDN